ncbi:MAG: hypothetical protein NT061_07405 [Spirochaetes bacterium]|nr:hypothetical protein [Spirochaetota bacterium]
MKKLASVVILLIVAALCFNACAGKAPLRKGEILIENKGTAFGGKTPKWVDAAIAGGAKDVEKIPDYKDFVIFIAQFEAQNLQSAQLLAERMQAQTELASYLSTRVKGAFKAANVDSKNFGVYGEQFIASVAQATYSGFGKDMDWWVKVQTYTPDNKPDKQIYRVIQLWTISKDMLQKQFDMILAGIAGSTPPAPETKRAMDVIQNAVTKAFFSGK